MLKELYWGKKLSLSQIAKKFCVSKKLVLNHMKKYNIQRRSQNYRNFNISKEQIKTLYYKQKHSLRQIAKMFRVSQPTIWRKMKAFNIQRRRTNSLNRYKIYNNTLNELYVTQKLSAIKISKLLGISNPGVIRDRLIKLKIRRRDRSEAGTRYVKLPFSESLEEKSYMLGLRSGDFYAKQDKKQVVIQTSSTRLAQFKMFKQTFEKYSKISLYRFNQTRFNVSEYTMRSYLDKTFDFLIDKQKEIPSWILNESKLFYNFLAAYADCEGCWTILRNKKSVRIVFKIDNQDIIILKQMQQKLIELGFHPKIYITKLKGTTTNVGNVTQNLYSMVIYQKKDLISLAQILLKLSKHEEKIMKMNFVINNYHKKWTDVSDSLAKLKAEIKSMTLEENLKNKK